MRALANLKNDAAVKISAANKFFPTTELSIGGLTGVLDQVMQNGDWTGGGTEEALMLLKDNDELWHKKFEDTVTLQGLGSSTGKKQRLIILSDARGSTAHGRLCKTYPGYDV